MIKKKITAYPVSIESEYARINKAYLAVLSAQNSVKHNLLVKELMTPEERQKLKYHLYRSLKMIAPVVKVASHRKSDKT